MREGGRGVALFSLWQKDNVSFGVCQGTGCRPTFILKPPYLLVRFWVFMFVGVFMCAFICVVACSCAYGCGCGYVGGSGWWLVGGSGAC
jgi:hypothetical protein